MSTLSDVKRQTHSAVMLSKDTGTELSLFVIVNIKYFQWFSNILWWNLSNCHFNYRIRNYMAKWGLKIPFLLGIIIFRLRTTAVEEKTKPQLLKLEDYRSMSDRLNRNNYSKAF